MTLALLVPNDYRQPAVLVRFGQFDASGRVPFNLVSEREADAESLRSFSESGGEMLRLHRDDQTVPGRRTP